MQFGYYRLRFDLIQRTSEAKRLRSLPRTYLLPPDVSCSDRLLQFLFVVFSTQHEKLRKSLSRISGDRETRSYVLSDVCGIDVDMNNARVRSERGQLAGHAIVKPHAYGDQQIALGHGHVCGVRSMHPKHAEREWMGRRESAESHQCRRHRQPECLRKNSQRFVSARVWNAAADVQHRTVRTQHRIERSLNRGPIETRSVTGEGKSYVVQS